MSVVGRAGGVSLCSAGIFLAEDLRIVISEELVGDTPVEVHAGIVDLIERERAGKVRKLGDLIRREAAALVKNRGGGKVGRCDIEGLRRRPSDIPRRRSHGGIELENGFRRIFLVPQSDRQNAALSEGPHVNRHRLPREGVLLGDGEAARRGKSGAVAEAQVDDIETPA